MTTALVQVETDAGIVTSEVTPHIQTVRVTNGAAVARKLLVVIPLHAWEASQAWTLLDSGTTTTGTGAYSATIVVNSGETIVYTLSSTYNSPTDLNGTTLTFGTATKSITVTEKVNDGGAAQVGVPVYEVGSTAVLGSPTAMRLLTRSAAGRTDRVALLQELMVTKNPQDTALLYDWIESGHGIVDIIKAYNALASAMIALTANTINESQGTFADLAAATAALNVTNEAINDMLAVFDAAGLA